jgi:hypothetical protein
MAVIHGRQGQGVVYPCERKGDDRVEANRKSRKGQDCGLQT